MIKISFPKFFRKTVVICIIAISWLCSCKDAPDYHRMHESNKPFFYSKKFRAIYINHCDVANLPDSIISKNALHLMIRCPKLTDYNILFKQLNPKEIISLRIDNLSNPSTTLNLARFVNLRIISIFGNENVKQINFNSLGDSLQRLTLIAPNLDFPRFDSSFSNLNYLNYKGSTHTIPNWVENMNNLTEFRFISENLLSIDLDICKMKKLKLFDIVGKGIENKEKHLKSSNVYPTLQQFKKCKPDLELIYRLPPG